MKTIDMTKNMIRDCLLVLGAALGIMLICGVFDSKKQTVIVQEFRPIMVMSTSAYFYR